LSAASQPDLKISISSKKVTGKKAIGQTKLVQLMQENIAREGIGRTLSSFLEIYH
jgi:hypothetical protein